MYKSILGFKNVAEKMDYPYLTHTVTQSTAIDEVRPMLKQGTVIVLGWTRTVGTLKKDAVIPSHVLILSREPDRIIIYDPPEETETNSSRTIPRAFQLFS